MAGNPDNIKKYQFTSEQSREKAAINGQKGGLASGEAKRENKRLLKALEFVLNSPVPESEKIFGEKTTHLILGMHAIAEKMKTGDVKAAEFVRDVIDKKPDEIPEDAKKIVRERIVIEL